MTGDVLDLFHPAIARWFRESFAGPTAPQSEGWSRREEGTERTEDDLQAALRVLFRRYWIFCGELVERESIGLRWREALVLLTKLVRGPTRRPSIRVRTWDGRPVTAPPISDELERLGCMREDPLMILYREFGGEG